MKKIASVLVGAFVLLLLQIVPARANLSCSDGTFNYRGVTSSGCSWGTVSHVTNGLTVRAISQDQNSASSCNELRVLAWYNYGYNHYTYSYVACGGSPTRPTFATVSRTWYKDGLQGVYALSLMNCVAYTNTCSQRMDWFV